MTESGKKRWLIKDREGRVRGPYLTDDILGRISRGEFSGDEQISLYPSTNWMPISNDPEFYDRLLESLDKERHQIDDDETITIDIPREQNDDDRLDDFVESKKPGKTETQSKRQAAHKTEVTPPPDRTEHQAPPHEEKSRPRGKTKGTAERVSRTETQEKPHEKAHEQPVIELNKMKKVLKKQRVKKTRAPFLVSVAVVALLVVYLLTEEVGMDNRIHLLAPRAGQPAISQELVKSKTQAALIEYVKDNFSNYLAAQEELIQVLEGDPKNAGAIALTCLTYLELWPHAHQDSADLQTLSSVTQMASRLDPAGVEAATCRTVDLMVRGRYSEAKGVTEMILDTFARQNKPPIAFYYFKAKLFEEAKDYDAAISYAQSAQQLWKQWLRVYTLEAGALAKAGRHNEAANKYRAILQINPQHLVARLELGIIEYKYIRNYELGLKFLEQAMAQKERAPRDVMARAYLGLAEISLHRGDPTKALDWAQKSYSLNSSEPRTKQIIVELGGEKKLRETKVADAQLVYEGDQLVREGDCNAAQAHYKTAFELNKKNGLAAMKAAECLWAVSLTTEAISWLDKAIKADPKLIDGYVLLADYYTQRYNYMAAGQILSKAKALFPTSYKVFRGFALVEFRRNNASGAVSFAQRAIQLYGSDVESYVILARAQMLKLDYAKAFEAASKATEIDTNNRQAQIAYAEALAGVRGLHIGIDYLARLVNTYPTVTEYRLALGQLYMKDQRFPSAQQLFEQVARMEDKPKRALIALGQALQEQKQYEAARDAYFKAATLDPADVEPLFLAGQLYLESKQPSEARQQFQRVLRINKDYPLVNYFIGKAALQLGSAEEALEQAGLEKAKNPNMADPYLLAADAYTELKQYSACAGEYQEAVRLRQASSDIYVKMARCYRMSGNLDAAVSMINQASHQESANPEAWKEQGAIYEVRQDFVKAIEAYSQYLVLVPNAPDRAQVEMRIRTLSR